MTKHSNVFQRKHCFTHIFSEITVKRHLKNVEENSKVASNSKKISKLIKELHEKDRGIKYKLNFTTGRTNDNHYERIVRNLIIKLADGSEIHIKDFITELPLSIDDNQKVEIMGMKNFKIYKESEEKKTIDIMEIEKSKNSKESEKKNIIVIPKIVQNLECKSQEEKIGRFKNVIVQEETCH